MQHLLFAYLTVALANAFDFKSPRLEAKDFGWKLESLVAEEKAEAPSGEAPPPGGSDGGADSPDNSCPLRSCQECFDEGLTCFRTTEAPTATTVRCIRDDCCSCWSPDSTTIPEDQVGETLLTGVYVSCSLPFPSRVTIEFGFFPRDSIQRQMCAAFANLMRSVNSDFETVGPPRNGFCIQQIGVTANNTFPLECANFGRLQLPASSFKGTDSEGDPLSPADSIHLRSVRCGIIAEFEVEPNDTPATAQPLPSPNSPIPPGISFSTKTSTTDPVASFDWYTFTLSEASEVTIETLPINENSQATDTELKLFDSSLIEKSSDGGDAGPGFTSKLVHEAPAGTYFLQVLGWPDVEWYPFIGYELRITVEKAIPIIPEVEPNDTPATAQALSNPSSPSAPGTILRVQTATDDPTTSFDWYVFTVAEPSDLTIETLPINADTFATDTRVFLYDGDVIYLDDDDDGGPGFTSKLEFGVPAGTYFVAVAAFGIVPWYAFIGYELKITVEGGGRRRLQEDRIPPPPPDEWGGDGGDPPIAKTPGVESPGVMKPTYPPQTFAFVEESPGRKDSIATAQHVDISDESKCVMVKGTLEETQHTDCYTFDSMKAGKLLNIKADLTMSPHPLILVSDMDGNPCDTREQTGGKANCRQREVCQMGTVGRAPLHPERTSCWFEFLKAGTYAVCLQQLVGTQEPNSYNLAWVNQN